jgi:hypothetical protein
MHSFKKNNEIEMQISFILFLASRDLVCNVQLIY